jgi:2Fe-2S ferredoxin
MIGSIPGTRRSTQFHRIHVSSIQDQSMVTLIFQSADGAQTAVEAAPGTTVMAAAIAHGIAGIDADCGGSMVCGTCHAMVDAHWQAQLPAQSPMEQALLEYVPEPHPNARLTCQIAVTAAIDGITFMLPACQR